MKCPHCGQKINVGSLMGSRRTKAKIQAARENGKKGGRPRKAPKAETPSEPANTKLADREQTRKARELAKDYRKLLKAAFPGANAQGLP